MFTLKEELWVRFFVATIGAMNFQKPIEGVEVSRAAFVADLGIIEFNKRYMI